MTNHISSISPKYIPRSLQWKLHEDLKRFNVIVCHRRFGKSVFAINHMQSLAVKNNNPMPRYAYIAPTYGQAKRIMWAYLKNYSSDFPGISINEADLRVDFSHNDARIMLLSAENPVSLKGIYLDGVILDEYAEMDPQAWREVIRPTLTDRKGWALFIGTPKGQNNFHELYVYAKDAKDPEWFSAMYKASETGIIDEDELASNRRQMTEEEYLQEFECFPADTMIATIRGNVPIQYIRPGDFVLTHRNRLRPVTAVNKKEYSGDLTVIKSFGDKDVISCTPEHPFLVYKKETQERFWVKAKDLKVDDCLLIPKIKSGPKILSEDWVKLLAWYICEGSVNQGSVSFSLNPRNLLEMSDVRNILFRMGYKAKWYASADGRSGQYVVCDVSLADRLNAWCGSLALNKRIPFDLISGYESIFFNELIRGDGCVIETMQGGKRFAFTTISRGLAYDVQLLASMLGRRSGIYFKNEREETILGRKVWCKKTYFLNISIGFKVNHSVTRDCFPTKLGIAFRIKEISTRSFVGTVYNFSVKQDESYVANGKAVHNCDFNAGIVGAYFSKELARAEKENRICSVPHDPLIPVDTYWDLGINDTTAIWFVQSTRFDHRIIDCYEVCGKSLPEIVSDIRNKGYNLDEFVLPHDAAVRDLSTGKSRQQILYALGCRRTRIVPRVGAGHKADSVNAARIVMNKCYFDNAKTAKGLKALANYQRKWNPKNNVFEDAPLHNWASNYADAFQCFGMGVRKEMGYSGDVSSRFMGKDEELLAETEYDLYA